uniref:Uncharacterized protein n=1 Tax=Arundo donax TaxID=35708 RepID=A0A0A9D6B0_ARUDO
MCSLFCFRLIVYVMPACPSLYSVNVQQVLMFFFPFQEQSNCFPMYLTLVLF